MMPVFGSLACAVVCLEGRLSFIKGATLHDKFLLVFRFVMLCGHVLVPLAILAILAKIPGVEHQILARCCIAMAFQSDQHETTSGSYRSFSYISERSWIVPLLCPLCT